MNVPISQEAKKMFQEKVESRITEGQRRATQKYNQKNAQIAIRIPPETKKSWDDYAKSHGISLRSLIISAVDAKIALDLDRLLDS